MRKVNTAAVVLETDVQAIIILEKIPLLEPDCLQILLYQNNR